MDVKTRYDVFIEENNDPFRDPPVLQKYTEAYILVFGKQS